jgi:chromate transport protein ChrA
MTKRPLTVTINLVIILISAFIWLALGIIIAANALPGLPDLPQMKGILAVLSIAVAGILLGLTFFLFKRNRTAYFLTLAFFGVTSILTIFDDVGLADIVFLLINLVPIMLLIKDRAWYLQSKPTIDGEHSADTLDG